MSVETDKVLSKPAKEQVRKITPAQVSLPPIELKQTPSYSCIDKPLGLFVVNGPQVMHGALSPPC